MDDYLGSSEVSRLNLAIGASDTFYSLPVCRGALTFRLIINRDSRKSSCETSFRISLRLGELLLPQNDMTCQTFWILFVTISRASLPARTDHRFFSDLYPCSHLRTLWVTLFAELPLHKITITFCEYLEARKLYLLELKLRSRKKMKCIWYKKKNRMK